MENSLDIAEAKDIREHGPDRQDLRGQVGALLPELRAFARFLARDRSAADDLVQDAIVRALGALHQFQAGDEPEGVAVHDPAQRIL